jgi:hypothetical protein
MRTSSIVFAVSIIILAGGSVGALLLPRSPEISPMAPVATASFDECVREGNPIMESFPRQCRDGAGNLFTEDIPELPPRQDTTVVSNQEKRTWIEIVSPTPNQKIVSPLEVSGVLFVPLSTTSTPTFRLVNSEGVILNENNISTSTTMPDGNISFTTMLAWTSAATGTATLTATGDHGDVAIPLSF